MTNVFLRGVLSITIQFLMAHNNWGGERVRYFLRISHRASCVAFLALLGY